MSDEDEKAKLDDILDECRLDEIWATSTTDGMPVDGILAAHKENTDCLRVLARLLLSLSLEQPFVYVLVGIKGPDGRLGDAMITNIPPPRHIETADKVLKRCAYTLFLMKTDEEQRAASAWQEARVAARYPKKETQ